MADLTAMLQAAAGAAVGDYQISRSLRFNSADSAYLSRTFSAPTNNKIWTFSAWVKRSKLDAANRSIFACYDGSSSFHASLSFNTNETLTGQYGGSSINAVTTTQVFRDPSAWYHLVWSVNATTGSSILYVNGSQSASTSIANVASQINSAISHNLGQLYSSLYFFDGYLTEINFIDGQALTPTSFGETNATTGVWSPIRYAGSYGTNGFYLNFSDNSGVTSTTLGKDQAGSNNWTPNNFSVTAGAGNDSLVDTPTQYGTDTGAGGEVRGNYCTLNPLDTNGANTFTNGNLDITVTNGETNVAVGTIGVSSGKWYWEVTPTSGTNGMIGISNIDAAITSSSWASANGWAYHSSNGNKFHNSSNSAYGASYTTNDVIGVALDMDAGTLAFYKNGSAQGTAYSSGISGKTIVPMVGNGANGEAQGYTANFGQRPFAYTAPSGFKALVTTNLPDPTVVQGDDYFNTVLYTGTGSSLGVTGVGFQPDWVWIKERSGAADHGLYDAVRGVQKQLESNNTDAETTETTGLTAFGSDGFTVGALAQLNTSADTFVAWNWNAGGSNATNTDGTITSTVRANPTAGFSIVSYTGTGPGSAANEIQVGHGLGVTPKMVIVKVRSTTGNWFVFTTVIDGSNDFLYLNTTDAAGNSGNTPPTSDVFYAGGALNTSSATYVAYCFAEVEGFSKFGSFVGNGSSNGAFVYLGFKPAFVMLKDSSVGGVGSNWGMFDNDRLGYNSAQRDLRANLSNAEGTDNDLIDFVSNGFKIRTTSSGFGGGSGTTYIYMAFAENPFKNSLAR